MQPQFLVPVLIVFIVVGIPVLCGTLLSLAKIVKGKPEAKASNGSRSDREEAEIVQDIHQMVTRLEKRIDALETIVIEKSNR